MPPISTAAAPPARHIALIEDEPAIRRNYADYLCARGYRISEFDSRASALAVLTDAPPDMAIIDVGLRDDAEGGFEVCRVLRDRNPALPLLFLTARDSELDAISGLRLGADDYLTKDISLPHLAARIAALFRRLEVLANPTPPAFASPQGTGQGSQQILKQGGLELDLDRFSARWHQQALELTLTEFWIVHALARHPGHVRNRQQLMDAANVVLDDSTITSHIKRIRRKFRALDAAFDQIQTMYGLGYRWHEPH